MSAIVVDNRLDRNIAVANAAEINAQISTAKSYVTLPAGEVTVDTPPALRSGIDLIGQPNGGTKLRLFTPGGSGGMTVLRYFAQIGYTNAADISRPVEKKEWMFEFRYYDEPPADGKLNMVRRVRVVSVGSGGAFVTDPPRNPLATSVQRFYKAWEVSTSIKCGDQFVILAEPGGVTRGMHLWITDGPLQNAGQGYMRQVELVEGNRVWLTRPLPRDFGPALACDIQPLVNCTVRNVMIDPGTFLWSVGVKGSSGFGMENVDCGMGNIQIISSGGYSARGVTGGAFELNTAAECKIQDCRAPYFYAEEGTDGIEILNTTLGPTRHGYPQNCFTSFFHVRNLKVRNLTIEGAGQPRGGWPTSSFSVFGDGMDFADVQMKYPLITGNQGPWAGFGGNKLQLHRVSNQGTALAITQGTGVEMSYVNGPYIECQNGTTGRALCCDPLNVVSGTGWQVVGQNGATPPRGVQAATAMKFAVPEGKEHLPPPPQFMHCPNAQPGKTPAK